MIGKPVRNGYRTRTYELIDERGASPARRYSLRGLAVTIGRGKDNDLVVQDPRVSRQHARLIWDGSHYVIQDLSSLNGTRVDGLPLSAPQRLRNGDQIELAPGVALTFLTRLYFSAS
jgi:pSer/pThr/pTyr-binding forkhead associated (FHA) protein